MVFSTPTAPRVDLNFTMYCKLQYQMGFGATIYRFLPLLVALGDAHFWSPDASMVENHIFRIRSNDFRAGREQLGTPYSGPAECAQRSAALLGGRARLLLRVSFLQTSSSEFERLSYYPCFILIPLLNPPRDLRIPHFAASPN